MIEKIEKQYNEPSENNEIDDFSEGRYKGEESIAYAKLIMDKLRNQNVIVEGEFEHDEWICYRKPKSKHKQTIDFLMNSPKLPLAKPLSPTLKNMVKCWSTELLLKITPTSLSRNLINLKRLIGFTKEFSEEQIGKLNEWLESPELELSDLQKSHIVRTALNFLDYCSLPNREEYISELQLIQKKYRRKGDVRDLPKYPDVLDFALILEHFSKVWNYEEKILYYPILLWWKITNIIPMRPSEFCDLKRNCITANKGRYFITVPREKQKGSAKHVEVTDTLEINKSIYNLITEYIKLTDKYGETQTLISYPAHLSKSEKKNKNTVFEFFNYDNLYRLLEKFYEEIVEKRYGRYDLERISLNDTRHFAFCSMMLQGFNALTIARMGGHQKIESQYHYQQHIDYFVQSQVYHLTKIHRGRLLQEISEEASTIELENARIEALRKKEEFDYLEEVEIGYCRDPKMNCEADLCQFCSKWWISMEDLHKYEAELRNLSELKAQRIQERLLLMERLRKDMLYDIESGTYNPEEQELLYRESKLCLGEMEDKAKIDAYLSLIS